MKGARPVWPVEATGNPPQPTGTAALVYWAPWSSEAITHGATKWRRRNGIRGSRPVSPPFGLSLFLEAASFYISVLPDAGRAGRCVKQSRIRLSSEGVGWRGGGGGWERKGTDCFKVTGCVDCLLTPAQPAPLAAFPGVRPAVPPSGSREGILAVDALRARCPPSGPSFALWEGPRPRPPGDCSGISRCPQPLHPCFPSRSRLTAPTPDGSSGRALSPPL